MPKRWFQQPPAADQTLQDGVPVQQVFALEPGERWICFGVNIENQTPGLEVAIERTIEVSYDNQVTWRHCGSAFRPRGVNMPNGWAWADMIYGKVNPGATHVRGTCVVTGGNLVTRFRGAASADAFDGDAKFWT